MKRQIREAYRMNKHGLLAVLTEKKCRLSLIHIYLNARKYETAADLTAMLNQYLEKWELLYGQEKKDRSPEERFAYRCV